MLKESSTDQGQKRQSTCYQVHASKLANNGTLNLRDVDLGQVIIEFLCPVSARDFSAVYNWKSKNVSQS